ncbi:MAG: PHP domain-containing protein [Myxococcota bacterium]
MQVIELREDLHVHSTYSDGRATLEENIERAAILGLERLGCVDHVRRDSDWVDGWLRTIETLNERAPIPLLPGVEAKILNEQGILDIPIDLPARVRIYAADHRLPLENTCLGLGEARRRMNCGELTASRVVRALVDSTMGALRRHKRLVIAHLFSMLPKLRLDESMVFDRDIEVLAELAFEQEAWLEIDERWKCPSVRVARIFAAAGVPIVASSDAHRIDALGRYDYVRHVANALCAA